MDICPGCPGQPDSTLAKPTLNSNTKTLTVTGQQMSATLALERRSKLMHRPTGATGAVGAEMDMGWVMKNGPTSISVSAFQAQEITHIRNI